MRTGFALTAKAVIIKDKKALILKRSEKEMNGSYLNQHEPWDLPGGSVRLSEQCSEGLLREIGEETALQVKVIKPLRVFDVIKNRLHMTIVTYLCIYKSGSVTLSDEHSEYYWLTQEEAQKMPLPKWLLKDIGKALHEAARGR